jgi:hypothetical protein
MESVDDPEAGMSTGAQAFEDGDRRKDRNALRSRLAAWG